MKRVHIIILASLFTTAVYGGMRSIELQQEKVAAEKRQWQEDMWSYNAQRLVLEDQQKAEAEKERKKALAKQERDDAKARAKPYQPPPYAPPVNSEGVMEMSIRMKAQQDMASAAAGAAVPITPVPQDTYDYGAATRNTYPQPHDRHCVTTYNGGVAITNCF